MLEIPGFHNSLTCSVARNTNIVTMGTVIVGNIIAVHQPALIPKTGYIIYENRTSSRAECRATSNSIYKMNERTFT